MKRTLRYKTHTLSLGALLAILSAAPLIALSGEASLTANARNIDVGTFTANVPAEWESFNEADAADLRSQYMVQSKEIYHQFSGSDDPSKSFDIEAFHINKDDGSFVIVSFTVPPQSDLISLLISQVKEKMAWGIREGYIRKYLGIVPVDNEQFSGFYTKVIGKNGGVQVSGALEHNELKDTVIQLTLLCPKTWDETKAANSLTSILQSVTLKER